MQATANGWASEAEYDCKDSQDYQTCEIERITEDQPEFCNMGNLNQCVGKTAKKILEERHKGTKNLSIADEQKENDLSQYDKLTSEQISKLRKEIEEIDETPF